ncbi:carbohydrate-binding protein [Clostridium oceanicum]|uniref:Carbohydrate-binding protein n=1 Tax=Clostridium oceanicum TaxID=1543 RepID=A0ABP3UQR8_9CLOT
MKKLISSMMVLSLLVIGLAVPFKNVHAADNNMVAYKISLPVDYNKTNTTDIKEVTLHYGVNGWNNIKNVKLNRQVVDYYMGKTFEAFTATIYVEKGSTLDYAFKETFNNGNVKWNNNIGKDYHVCVEKTNIN